MVDMAINIIVGIMVDLFIFVAVGMADDLHNM